MNIYKHTGNGHYIGSCVIVAEDNLQLATSLIRHILDNNGLENEELNIVEFQDLQAGAIIHVHNGDY